MARSGPWPGIQRGHPGRSDASVPAKHLPRTPHGLEPPFANATLPRGLGRPGGLVGECHVDDRIGAGRRPSPFGLGSPGGRCLDALVDGSGRTRGVVALGTTRAGLAQPPLNKGHAPSGCSDCFGSPEPAFCIQGLFWKSTIFCHQQGFDGLGPRAHRLGLMAGLKG